MIDPAVKIYAICSLQWLVKILKITFVAIFSAWAVFILFVPHTVSMSWTHKFGLWKSKKDGVFGWLLEGKNVLLILYWHTNVVWSHKTISRLHVAAYLEMYCRFTTTLLHYGLRYNILKFAAMLKKISKLLEFNLAASCDVISTIFF